MHFLEAIFGNGSDLNGLQMSVRAAAVFLITLIMLRTAGRRSLGMHSAFDSCTTVLLGAVLSRAVVGASPFWPTVAGALVIVLLHRLLALASIRWRFVGDLINGKERRLALNGRVDWNAMRKALVTRHDLERALWQKASTTDLAQIREATLERDGKITIVVLDR